jgi:hypothetical protein
MAQRLNLDVPCVMKHLPALNAAATWYHSMSAPSSGISPSKRVRSLKSAEIQAEQLRKSLLEAEKKARRLLHVYGIKRPEEAEDGAQLEALAVALEIVTEPDEVRNWLATISAMITATSKAVNLFGDSSSSEDAAVR